MIALLLALALTPDQMVAREILAELIAIDTTDKNGNNTTAAEAMARRLRAAGLPAADVQVMGPSPRKGNLVARLRGTGKRKPLCLLGHLDVVAANREDWTIDPFKLTERDGYFYGRGTSDMKGQVAIWVTTVLRLQREKRKPDRDLLLVLTADEENGPENGVKWLIAHHRSLIDAAYCLNEGGGGELKKGERRGNHIQASEKEFRTWRIEVTNKGGHSSLPVADNAIVRLGEALARIHRFVFPARVDEVTRAQFARQAALETGPLAADLRAVAAAKPGQAPDAAATARLSQVPYLNARLRTTCVPTMIQGGHAENALPQRASAIVNCRIFPGEPHDEVMRTIQRVAADPEAHVTAADEPNFGPPSPLLPELMSVAEAVTREKWPGVPVLPVMLAGATDGRFLRAAGIPTYGLTGLFHDVDDVRAHGRDERISVKSFFEAQEFLERVVRRLSGL